MKSTSATTANSGNASALAQAYAANHTARNLILRGNPSAGIGRAINNWQQVFSQTFTGANLLGTVINIPVKPVGLVKRLLVKVSAKINAGAASTQNRGPFGPGAFFSNVQFQDLSQYQRHNIGCWALEFISTAKRRRIYGAAATTDTPFGWGSNYVVNALAATIAANGNTTMTAYYEVPISVDDEDLRGVIDAGVTNANAFLQLTVNPNMFVASAGDKTLALYQSAGADLASIDSATGFTVTVYQNFLDQLPRINGQLVLPRLDLSHAYMLNGSATSLPVAAQDNGINIPNLREILSASLIYDNAGSLNAGSDINYFALQSANLYNLWKLDPITQMLQTRGLIGDDPPSGSYYFDFRRAPIETAQYGNMNLVVNPSSVGGASATFLYALESVGLTGAVMQAGSLQSP